MFYAYPALTGREEEKTPSPPLVLSLWHVDTFEGGRGSRAAFLKRAASAYCRSRSETYVLVSQYTVEGVKEAFSRGAYPDLLSFGAGCAIDPSLFLPLSGKVFSSVSLCEGDVVYPWCVGAYFLFSKTENFSRANLSTAIVSGGRNNLAQTAAALYFSSVGDFSGGGIKRENWLIEESTAAYVDFLQGKREYLFGTQRDVFRFSVRKAEVFARVSCAYDDLYQYAGVTNAGEATGRSGAEGKRAKSECAEFLAYLLSENVQKRLTEIGMLSPLFDVYGEEFPLLNGAESEIFGASGKRAEYAADVFSSAEARSEAERLAAEGNATALKNFLKRM